MSASFSRDRRGVSARMKDVSTDGPKKYSISDFDGAVTSSAVNLVRNGGALITPKPPEQVGQATIPPSGRTVLARCSNGSVELMKVGTSLYARTTSGTIVCVANNVLNLLRGIIFRFDGNFYVTDMPLGQYKIYKVTDNLVFSEVTPTVPLIYTNLAQGAGGTDTMDTFEEAPNAISDYVDVGYALGKTAVSSFTVPSSIKVDSVQSITLSNGRTYTGTCTVSVSSGRQVVSVSPSISNNITVRYKLASGAVEGKLTLSSFSPLRMALFNADFVTEYFSPGDEYETVLGTVGGEKRFYIVGISNILNIPMDAVTFFKIDESPKSMIKYSDGVLVFTQNRVLFIKVTGSGNVSNFDAEVSVIKRDFGCDMPFTVAGFDDHIIFANSQNGVFYLNKFGYNEKDGSCLVSDPIYSDMFSHTENELKAATAMCTKDSYYISVGDSVYVWRYVDRLPSSPTESADLRKRYVWSKLDMINTDDFLCFSGGNVYMIERTSANVYLYHSSQYGGDGDDISSYLELCGLDLGDNGEKVLTGLRIEMRQFGDVEVRICYDGVYSSAVYTVEKSDFDMVNSVDIRPERHKFKTVGLEISSDDPVEITQIDFFWRNTR